MGATCVETNIWIGTTFGFSARYKFRHLRSRKVFHNMQNFRIKAAQRTPFSETKALVQGRRRSFKYPRSTNLAVFNVHSNFPELKTLSETLAGVAIDKLQFIFATYRIQVCTDLAFCPRAVISSPSATCTVSNTLLIVPEKGVKIIKGVLERTASHAHEDFWLGLLSYRSPSLEVGRPS